MTISNRNLKILVGASLALCLASPGLGANRLGQNAGGGGKQKAANLQRPAQRPANMQRPAPAQRPANVQRPAPAQRPAAQRPSNVQRPANRPAPSGGGRLSNVNKPANLSRPQTAPAHRPAGSVQRPQLPQHSGSRPQLAGKLPTGVPTRPANLGQNRPNKPIDFGELTAQRKPGGVPDKMANLTNRRPADLLRPATRPALPNQDRRPGSNLQGKRPGSVPGRDQLDKYPGLADKLDQRPGGYDQWQQNRDKHWDALRNQRADRLDEFQVNRDDRWDNISSLQDNRQDFFTNRREDWQSWANNVQDYRQDRAWEILDNVRDYNSNLFVPDWYAGNPWWNSSWNYYNNNPWVWWRPAVWTGLAAFLGGAVSHQINRDYGTHVYYDKETVYVEGQPVAPAPEYRQQALDLAAVEAPGEPFVPAEKGDEDGWYPLGVWALTQEEKGDAVMFYQLAISKAGEVSGAYSNVLTGESSPVTGSIDFETQRVAWRTGDAGSTAIEANLAGLTKEFTPVFVHYGNGLSQEWLLVRMEDPS